jgi:hypothetical protein
MINLKIKEILKIAILTVLVYLVCLTCYSYAQDTTFTFPKEFPKPGGYGQNSNLNKFKGTWHWQSGDTVFTIVLGKYIYKSKRETGFLKGYSRDAIIGWHEYKIGEKIIESSLSHVGEHRNMKTFTILGGDIHDVDKLTITGFIDLSKSKTGCATLELLPGEKDIAKWELRETPGIKIIDPGETPDYTFTVPTNVIMHRVKGNGK